MGSWVGGNGLGIIICYYLLAGFCPLHIMMYILLLYELVLATRQSMHGIFIYTTVVLYALLCCALRCLARSGEISNALLLGARRIPRALCTASGLPRPLSLCALRALFRHMHTYYY